MRNITDCQSKPIIQPNIYSQTQNKTSEDKSKTNRSKRTDRQKDRQSKRQTDGEKGTYHLFYTL